MNPFIHACLLTSFGLSVSASLFAATISNPSFEDNFPEEGGIRPPFVTAAPAGWTEWNRLEFTTSILTSSPDWANAAAAGIGAVSDGDYILMLDSYKATGPDGVEYAEAGVRTTITGLNVGETYLITVDASSLWFSTAWVSSGYLDAYLGTAGSSALTLLSTNHVTDQQLYEAFIHTGGTFGTYSYSFVADAEEMEFGLRSRVSDPDGVNFGKPYSMAIDNLSIAAIPEPASALLAACSLFPLLKRRRD